MSFVRCLLGYFLLAISLVRSTDLLAQKQGRQLIDSLAAILPQLKEDTNRVKVLKVLCFNSAFTNSTEGIKYGEEGLDLATRLEWRPGQAMMNNNLGITWFIKANYPKALEYYLAALKIYEANDDKAGVAKVIGNIATLYNRQQNYSKAIEYNLRALKIFQEAGDKHEIGATLGNIGACYDGMHESNKEIDYDFRALQIYKELNDTAGMAINLGNIGSAYSSLNDFNRALEYSFQALQLHRSIDDKNGAALVMGNIGEIYLKIAKDTTGKIPPGKFIPHGKKQILDTAVSYLNQAIEIEKAEGELDNLQTVAKILSEAEALSGHFEKALTAYTQYVLFKDSVYSQENKIRITNMETERELALKQKQIEINKLAVEKKRNERVLFLSGIFLLLLVIVFITRNYNTQKRSNHLLTLEKNRSEDLLLNILPSEVAEELKSTGAALARNFDNITVLFTDFVNFTQASERMGPRELIDELHICFKAFDQITANHNVEKIKTVGDAYLAVAGLPNSNPDHAINLVSAAIEIRDFMALRHQQIGDKTFRLRIGIHSGSVVAGIVGVRKFAYDIWGDTVNITARMEQNCEPGKINISQTTYDLVKDKVDCEYRGEIEAKGKGMMKMYYVS